MATKVLATTASSKIIVSVFGVTLKSTEKLTNLVLTVSVTTTNAVTLLIVTMLFGTCATSKNTPLGTVTKDVAILLRKFAWGLMEATSSGSKSTTTW